MRTGQSIAAALALWTTLHHSGRCEHLGLTMTLEPEHQVVEAGVGLRLNVAFRNDGTQAFYLYRPPQLGGAGLEVLARRKGCEATVAQYHENYTDDAMRYFFVPLWPRRGLVETIVLNDPEATEYREIPLVRPGLYHYSIRLQSKGGAARRFEPLWRGEVRTNEVTVEITAPRSEAILAWRDRLRVCLAKRCESGAPEIRYFRLVRDEQAADMLVELLRRHPAQDDLIDAVTRQGRPQDADVLRELADRAGSPWTLPSLAERIKRLESADLCW